MRAPAPSESGPAAPAFRRALGRFATGVVLVTAPGGEALVVNAFTSVSLEPPLVAFCPARSSLTWRRMRRSGVLGVNILPACVDDIGQRARPGADRLAGLRTVPAADDVPRLAAALTFLRCRPLEERPAGDHLVVLCHVLEAVTRDDGEPLVFFGGEFGSFAQPR